MISELGILPMLWLVYFVGLVYLWVSGHGYYTFSKVALLYPKYSTETITERVAHGSCLLYEAFILLLIWGGAAGDRFVLRKIRDLQSTTASRQYIFWRTFPLIRCLALLLFIGSVFAVHWQIELRASEVSEMLVVSFHLLPLLMATSVYSWYFGGNLLLLLACTLIILMPYLEVFCLAYPATLGVLVYTLRQIRLLYDEGTNDV